MANNKRDEITSVYNNTRDEIENLKYDLDLYDNLQADLYKYFDKCERINKLIISAVDIYGHNNFFDLEKKYKSFIKSLIEKNNENIEFLKTTKKQF